MAIEPAILVCIISQVRAEMNYGVAISQAAISCAESLSMSPEAALEHLHSNG